MHLCVQLKLWVSLFDLFLSLSLSRAVDVKVASGRGARMQLHFTCKMHANLVSGRLL